MTKAKQSDKQPESYRSFTSEHPELFEQAQPSSISRNVNISDMLFKMLQRKQESKQLTDFKDNGSRSPEPDEALRSDEDMAHWKPTNHELLIMVSLSIISMMIALDATVIITSLPTIVADLHGTTTLGLWLGTSYLLTCASPMLFIAALSDIFGRPPCLLLSLAFFTVGTVICSVGKGFAALLAGRCIQGIGGGGIIILGLVIFTDIVPLRYRPKYYGMIQGAWALGTIIGPLLGGAFAERTSWRWVFFLMFPFCGIGVVSITWLLTLKLPETTFKDKLARVDWLGGFLFISSTTTFLIAISWGGTQEAWDSFRTLVPLVLGIMGIGATMAWERFGTDNPFLRKSLFYCPSSFVAYFGAAAQGFWLYAGLYYFSFYFLSVKQYSPSRAGVSMLPAVLATVPASVIVGAIITRINHFRWAIWSGWVIVTLGGGLVIIWDADTSTPVWAVILVLVGIGNGLLLNAQNFATQAIAKPKDEASAAALYAFMRSFGMAFGVGISGSIFQNVMKTKLSQLGLPTEIAADSLAYIATLETLPDASVLKEQVLQAYVSGFRGVFGTLCGLAGLSGIASLFIGQFDLNKVLNSDHKLQEKRWSRKPAVAVTSFGPEDGEKVAPGSSTSGG